MNKTKYQHQAGIIPIILLLCCSLLVSIKSYGADNGGSDPMALRDPTRPADHIITDSADLNENRIAPVKQGNLIVTAIFASKHRKIAIINGQVLRVGQTIGNYTIDSIEHADVTLRDKEGKIITLSPAQKPLTVKTFAKES